MVRTLTKWAVILALAAALAGLGTWLGYKWGWSDHKAEAAQARAEAVSQALDEAGAAYADALDRQRVRARAAAERMEQLRDELREQTQRAERYAASEEGAKSCFEKEGVQQWNEY